MYICTCTLKYQVCPTYTYMYIRTRSAHTIINLRMHNKCWAILSNYPASCSRCQLISYVFVRKMASGGLLFLALFYIFRWYMYIHVDVRTCTCTCSYWSANNKLTKFLSTYVHVHVHVHVCAYIQCRDVAYMYVHVLI